MKNLSESGIIISIDWLLDDKSEQVISSWWNVSEILEGNSDVQDSDYKLSKQKDILNIGLTGNESMIYSWDTSTSYSKEGASFDKKNFKTFWLDNKITFFLNSHDFTSIFTDNWKLLDAIWIMVEFFTIFDSLDFEDYLNFAIEISNSDFCEKKKYNLIYNIIKKYLWKDDLSSEDLFDYLFTKYHLNGFYYHCFNWINEESIRKKWLSANIRDFTLDEIEEVIHISLRADLSYRDYDPRKTWFPCLLTNSQWKISLSSTPQQISHYLYDVPEWFAIFITRLTDKTWIRNSFKEKEPYSSVKNVIINSIELIVTNIEDKIYLLRFIEKYWTQYTQKENKIALVKKSSIDRIMSEKEIDNIMENILFFSNSPEETISLILSPQKSYFEFLSDISPNDIYIVSPVKNTI